MKHIIFFFIAIISIAAAAPGNQELICKSKASQKIELRILRSNVLGLSAPEVEIIDNDKHYILDTPDEMNSYGTSFRNAALGVIVITATNSAEKSAKITGSFEVVALPSTVKAYDQNGRIKKWNLSDEGKECNDASGKAVFKGLFKGEYKTTLPNGKITRRKFQPQVLDCELNYNSGSAC